MGVIAGAAVSSQLILRFRPRIVMSVGLMMAITGMLWFSQIGVHTGYWNHLFPAELVMAFGMGMVFVPVNNTALIGVEPGNAGVASALINSTQQVGGSVGTALLNTIATTVTVSYLHTHGVAGAGAVAAGAGGAGASAPLATVTAATVHGFAVAFAVAAAILGLALVVVATFINAPVGSTGTPSPEGAGEFEDAGEGTAGEMAGELAPGWLPA